MGILEILLVQGGLALMQEEQMGEFMDYMVQTIQHPLENMYPMDVFVYRKLRLKQLYDEVAIGTKILIVHSKQSFEQLAHEAGAIS